MIIHAIMLAAILAPGGAPGGGTMPLVRDVRVDFTYKIPARPPGSKVLDLWIPVPQSNERQSVRLLNEAQLGEGRFTEDKTFGNRIYYRRFEGPTENGATEPIQLVLSFEAEVHEWEIPAAKSRSVPRVPPFDTRRTPYLIPTKTIPLGGPIAELAGAIDPPVDDPLVAGRKIYDHLVDTMVYNYLAPGCGKGDAAWACGSKTGDCTDFHSVFLGVCRKRGIPADHVFGLPMPPDKPEGVSRYCHCWARFWVAGVGWIPIDASMADKFPAQRDYYFGTLGSTWLTMTHGRDVVLEPPQQGEPINMFDAPYAEIDGEPVERVRWSAHYQNRPEPPPAR